MDETKSMTALMNTSDKNRKTDIIFLLKVSDGTKPKSSTGIVDPELFKEGTGNRLHAVVDPQTMLWSLKYDKGVLPPVLKSRFTSYTKLYNHVKEYMLKRNVEIKEVID